MEPQKMSEGSPGKEIEREGGDGAGVGGEAGKTASGMCWRGEAPLGPCAGAEWEQGRWESWAEGKSRVGCRGQGRRAPEDCTGS